MSTDPIPRRPRPTARPRLRPSVPDLDDRTRRQSGEIRKLTSLLDVSQALASPANLKSAFHRVLEILERYHGTGRSVIALPREDGRRLFCTRPSASARRIPTRRSAARWPSRSSRAAGRSSSRASARSRRWPRTSRGRIRRRAAPEARVTQVAGRGLRRGRPDVHLRPGAAVAAVPGRPRGRAGVPKRSQLRPDDEVLWRRRIDAGAGAQDADARRSGSAAPGERERAAARRAARALRLLAHPRHERRDAAGVRAGGAGRPRPTRPSSSAASRGPARSSSRRRSTTTRCARGSRSSR